MTKNGRYDLGAWADADDDDDASWQKGNEKGDWRAQGKK